MGHRSSTRKKRLHKGGNPFPRNKEEKQKKAIAKRESFLAKYSHAVPYPVANQRYMPIPFEMLNNGDYTHIKYTFIEPGTRFLFRSKKELKAEDIQRKPMWLNYSASKGKSSFLLTNETGELNNRIPRGMALYFGDWINTIEIKDYIIIVHFPVLYDAPNDPDSFPSYYEGVVKQLCVHWKMPFCAAGYTLDFLFAPHYSKKLGWENIGPIPGYRELCLLDPQLGKTIEFISSEYKPISAPSPSHTN
jgi:hypothetical protein